MQTWDVSLPDPEINISVFFMVISKIVEEHITSFGEALKLFRLQPIFIRQVVWDAFLTFI